MIVQHCNGANADMAATIADLVAGLRWALPTIERLLNSGADILDREQRERFESARGAILRASGL